MNAKPHQRKSIRLPGYDYAQAGAYFVTMVIQGRRPFLGLIENDEFIPSAIGQLVTDAWAWLGRQYPYILLDEFCLMPNHLHGILIITSNDAGRGGSRAAPTRVTPTTNDAPIQKVKPLGQIIGAFKTVSTKQVNALRRSPGLPLWQRNYYEHVIRNDQDLGRARVYIRTNPSNWMWDSENSSK